MTLEVTGVTRQVPLPTGDAEYDRLLLLCASRVLAVLPAAWCGVVVMGGARVGTYFVWDDVRGNLSEGCSGPLMAWFEAMEAVRE